MLGVVGEGYEPLQNRAAFAFCDAITDSGEAHWLGAGETRGGARVHALMQLDREIRIGDAEGEDVLPLLCFRNGHDGGLAVTISVAPFRLACLNGMMLPLDGAERTWKARHTANLDARLADARRTLGIAWRYYDELEQVGGRLIRERMSAAEFERFLAQLVPLPEPRPRRDERRARGAQRRAGARGDRDRLPRRRPTSANITGTRWGALQAVTAYVDHVQPTRATAGRSHQEARFERATEPPPLKDRALALLTEGGDAVMTATLSMVPLAQIRPSKAQPARRVRRRADGRADRVREAARDHHAADALARRRRPLRDHRRASAATARRRRRSSARCPPRCARSTGEALTLAVAENVIRADLSPLEEARAYRRLVDEHGDAAKVAQARRQERAAGRASGSTCCACPTRRRSCSPRAGCRSPARPR